MANQAMNAVGGLEPLNTVLYTLIERLSKVDRKLFWQEH